MKESDEISKELREIAPRLAQLSKTNVYRVPEGYFVNFSNEIVKKVTLGEVWQELTEVAPAFAKIDKKWAAPVPANYFTSFSDGLIKKIRASEVLEELSQIAPTLAKLEKVNALQVPAEYFNALPQNILGKINAQQGSASQPASGFGAAINGWFEKVLAPVFQPKYSAVFAGFATLLIIAVVAFTKVQTCDDLDCKLAQLTNAEINSYLEHPSDAYSDAIFESVDDYQTVPASTEINNIHPYKDALNDINDAALTEAIQD